MTVSFQRIFAFVAFGVLLAFLGSAVSCNSSDDDSSGGSGSAFEFKGGADPITEAGALQGQVRETPKALAGTSEDDVVAEKLPKLNTPVKLCSIILVPTTGNYPESFIWRPDDPRGADIVATSGQDQNDDGTDDTAEHRAQDVVDALAGEPGAEKQEISYKGFTFEVKKVGTAADGKIQVRVKPKLNVGHKVAFVLHAAKGRG